MHLWIFAAEWLGLTSSTACLRKQYIRVSQASFCLRPTNSLAERTRNQSPYTLFLTFEVPSLPTHICIWYEMCMSFVLNTVRCFRCQKLGILNNSAVHPALCAGIVARWWHPLSKSPVLCQLWWYPSLGWQEMPVCGWEIHIRIKSKRKLYISWSPEVIYRM
jgi:hypothetical protein